MWRALLGDGRRHHPPDVKRTADRHYKTYGGPGRSFLRHRTLTHTASLAALGPGPPLRYSKHTAAGDYILSARTDMLALQNAGGDNFVTPGEFAALLQISYKLFQHRRDKPDAKSVDANGPPKAKDDDAALREAAKQSHRKVSRILSQFTKPARHGRVLTPATGAP